jgi:Calx-beta domain
MIRVLATFFLFMLWSAPEAAETLEIKFTTSNSSNQDWRDLNVQAVWVETTSGVFQKTIGNWSRPGRTPLGERAELKQWNSKSPSGDTDGEMGPTRINHNEIVAKWDMTPKGSTTPVVDGTYKIWFENTNAEGGFPRHLTSIDFVKNGKPATGTIASQGGYTNIKWSYSGRAAPLPTVAWTSVSQTSVGESGTLTVTAQLSAASGQIVSVPFTVSGTSTSADRTITASPITIAAGATAGTATITITADTVDEPNETVILKMGTPTNATLGATTEHTATITDDDAASTVQWAAASQTSVGETGTLTVTAQLSAASGQSVSVPFTVSGTSTSADRTITATPISIAAGATTGTATITITSDTLDEADETVILTLGTPTNATLGATTEHTATITDDDATPTVAFTASSSSGSESVTAVTIPVTLSASSGKTVTVAYAVSGGTATGSGTDFTLASGMLTFSAGTTTQTIAVTVVNDTLSEGNETIEVTLSSPTNAALGANPAHIYTITDNDSGLPTIQWTAASQASVGETGTLTVTAQLSATSASIVTVPFTVTGTATGTDFTITVTPISIAAGATTGTATITITTDTVDEPNETVILTLDPPTNATLGVTTMHTATITDDDGSGGGGSGGGSSGGGGGGGCGVGALSALLLGLFLGLGLRRQANRNGV